MSDNEMFVMKGGFPREFLEAIGMVEAEIPTYTEKIGGIQPTPERFGKNFIERVIEHSNKQSVAYHPEDRNE